MCGVGFFSDRRASKAAYQELQSQGYLRYDHLPLESKTGLSVEVEFICNTYHVEGLEVAQCNIRDIDERSRLERKMQEQSAALADLHRRKDEFLAMLSHELRNPLSPILNAVHMLRLDNDLKPLQLEASGIIERQVGQLTRLVDDLMEVSRISTGRVQLRFERLSANGIVERAIESVRPLIERHHHEITISLSPEPIWLRADATRLEQVVVNLLTNAAKYTADGGRISISVREACDECVIRVRDSGIGIAPDLLPRIFDIFTQAERSLDRSQGGLGIGLALVQRLVEMHRGRVDVSSSLGEGSDFVVRIPVATAGGSEPQEREPEMPASDGPSLRVLVVDDNTDAAASLAMVVRSFGHKVRTAADGPSAIAAAVEYGPNVVLLDIGLPKMNGYEVAKRMRQVPNLSGATLIALTGYGQDSDRQRSLESGFDEHLVKPVPIKRVSEILATVQADGE